MHEIAFEEKPGLNFVEHRMTLPYGTGDRVITLSTGKLAKQAAGAVLAQVGETVVLAAVVISEKESTLDFFPLMVDYREKFYAGGRIPGGFFKREARPSDNETLNARLIDRTIRPLFPDNFRNEVQVYITVLAADLVNTPEIPAMIAASAALHISKIPFKTPIAGCRVGRIDGSIVINPTAEQMATSDLDIAVAGHSSAINMVEAAAKEVGEDVIVDALEAGHRYIKATCAAIEELRRKCGQPKMEVKVAGEDTELKAAVDAAMKPHIAAIQATHEKNAREARVRQAATEVCAALAEKFPDQESAIRHFVEAVDEREMRRRVIREGIRADGRKPTDIRPIWCETDVLPRVHGSSLFTRGQTQALAVVTLGGPRDNQMIDDMTGVSYKSFLLHYNFPSYSVGEARPPRGPGRREIGHGALAERALLSLIPPKDVFPYTIRLVVEILESNGSSSMATVCAGALALMDAGVPIKAPAAGVAMGLISDDDGNYVILTDIQGVEDHLGDMDFKVTGTRAGVTALQMDIKVEGVTRELLARALSQARDARMQILDKMETALAAPRVELKPQTPRIVIVKIPTEKIREVIGSGGKVIREIVEVSGAQVDIEEDGTVFVMSANKESMDRAIAMIRSIVEDLEEGTILTGTVTRIIDSGAIVQLGPGKDGMIHISELEHRRVATVNEVLKEGEVVQVKVLEVDKERGRVRLSRKALIARPDGTMPDESDSAPAPPRREGGFGGRGGDRGGRGGLDRPRGDRPSRDVGDIRPPRPPRPPRGN
jgi:polyribonucleotide nucleotidyltransferase